MPQKAPETLNTRLVPAGIVLAVLTYFIYSTYDSLDVYFNKDSIFNIAYYFRSFDIGRLLLAQLTPWRGVYRPMGGLFYLTIFKEFGLNPVPYHVVTLAAILPIVYLVYRLARELGAGKPAACAAAIVSCYHAGLANLYYNLSFVYDVLCCLFYLAALVYYVRIRASGRYLNSLETCLFLGLYLCSLNSKEMAVTMPLILVGYECVYFSQRMWSKAGLLTMLSRGRVAILAACLTIFELYGLIFGSSPLAGTAAYRPVFSLRRLKAFQIASLNDLLLGWHWSWKGIIGLWLVLWYLAWRKPNPVLRFCWIFMLLTPLPIEFLESRSGACLAIPMAGWAIFASTIAFAAARDLGDYLKDEPIFRFTSPKRITAAIMIVVWCLWARENRALKPGSEAIDLMTREVREVFEEFQAANPSVRPNSHIAFVDDPFHTWDILYFAELWFHDRSLTFHIQPMDPLPPDQLSKADYIFTFEGSKMIRLK